MALPKIETARELSNEELEAEILTTKKQIFELRFKKATRQPVKPHEFGHMKHKLSQLMTVEHERKLAQSAEGGDN